MSGLAVEGKAFVRTTSNELTGERILDFWRHWLPRPRAGAPPFVRQRTRPVLARRSQALDHPQPTRAEQQCRLCGRRHPRQRPGGGCAASLPADHRGHRGGPEAGRYLRNDSLREHSNQRARNQERGRRSKPASGSAAGAAFRADGFDRQSLRSDQRVRNVQGSRRTAGDEPVPGPRAAALHRRPLRKRAAVPRLDHSAVSVAGQQRRQLHGHASADDAFCHDARREHRSHHRHREARGHRAKYGCRSFGRCGSSTSRRFFPTATESPSS